ncbi:MAG TPA: methyltransferase domain-containing protein [Thermodesulfobacteriota bacterium]|nr:methyltransferase domain-containing protein [Thermodesulfobacteriota bacterium]
MNREQPETAPTQRFSTRAKYYDQYRPGYPEEIISFLKGECGLSSSSIIADIGSGTGILSRLFLRNGNIVFGIEPNREMREVAEELLKEYPNFRSVNGNAEATNLDGKRVDFATAGQAFHWFGVEKSKEEFRRILKPGGWVVLIWNDRRTDSTPFLQAYEGLLINFGTDYKKVDFKNFDAGVFTSFFDKEGFNVRLFDNFQIFDLESLKGRVNSSSYVPAEGDPKHGQMMEELSRIFFKYQSDGKVMLEYDTKVYYGRI